MRVKYHRRTGDRLVHEADSDKRVVSAAAYRVAGPGSVAPEAMRDMASGSGDPAAIVPQPCTVPSDHGVVAMAPSLLGLNVALFSGWVATC
jgi:hypothetical protein